jgi:hypothetical protein
MSKAAKTSTKKTYPRATVKKIIKGHSNKSVGRNVDALVSVRRRHRDVAAADIFFGKVYIDFVLFIQE